MRSDVPAGARCAARREPICSRVMSPPLAVRSRRPAPAPAAEWLAIAAGGAIGATLRVALGRIVDLGDASPGLVAATLASNLIGAFALGFLLGRLTVRPTHPLLRPFLAVGVLGSFTTWSTLVAEGHRLLALGGAAPALLYGFASLVLGLAAARAGLGLGRAGGGAT